MGRESAGLAKIHDHVKPPKDGTPQWRKWRETLARLVTADGFSEQTILDVLRWVMFTEEPKQDGFLWRQQLQSLAALRNKTRNDVTKFAGMYSAWKASRSSHQVKIPDWAREAQAIMEGQDDDSND